MKLEIYQSEDTLARTLAGTVAAAIHHNPTIVLGLPTGRTPLAFYRALVALTHEREVDWSGVRTFNLDEFEGLAADSHGSYRRFMQENLFDHVNIRAEHIGFLDGRAANVHVECERYERAIKEAGGIDIMLLGIGGNGHIGFNEPCDVLPARTHRVLLAERTRLANALWFGGAVEAVPRAALSMGVATILNSREVVLVATGEGKRDVVRGMVTGGITTQLPASLLQLHTRVTVMLDEAAAAGLRAANY